MSFVMFNNNPYGKQVGDCIIRAVSKALDQSWETSYIDLVACGYEMKDIPSSNAVLNHYLRSKGFRRYTIPNTCPDCYTFLDFANDHPTGTYILGTGSHVACVKFGDLWDSWNSSGETPIVYWKKEI